MSPHGLALLRTVITTFFIAGCDREEPSASARQEVVENVPQQEKTSTLNAIATLDEFRFVDLATDAPCGGVCPEQEVGFEWAKSRAVWKAEQCLGGPAFIEGCKTYVAAFRKLRPTLK